MDTKMEQGMTIGRPRGLKVTTRLHAWAMASVLWCQAIAYVNQKQMKKKTKTAELELSAQSHKSGTRMLAEQVLSYWRRTSCSQGMKKMLPAD